MDFARGLGRLRALFDGPRAHLFLAGGEEADKAQQTVARADEPVEARFRKAHVGEEELFLLRLHAGDFGLGFGADGQHGRALGLGGLPDHLKERVVLHPALEVVLAHVGGVNHGLGRQQRHGGQQRGLVLGALHRAGGLPGVQRFLDPQEEIQLFLVFFVGLNQFSGLFDAAVEHLEVGEDQLHVDGLDVALRVDAALHVDDVVVHEAAHHVDHGVALADVGEELVAQPLSLGGPAHQAGDVDELDGRGRVFARVAQVREPVEALVRHGDDAHVRLDGAERVVGGLRPRVGDGVEQRALPDVRKSDNPQFHSTESSFISV